MGFLEDLRRKNAEEKKAAERAAEQERRAETQPGEAGLEQQRTKVLMEEAVKRAESHFNQSGLRNLVSSLAELEGHLPRFSDIKGIYVCRINLQYQLSSSSYIIIIIETDSQGTIKFRGNIFGNSTIAQSTWQQDRSVLETALGKAYSHPKIEHISNPPSSGVSWPMQ